MLCFSPLEWTLSVVLKYTCTRVQFIRLSSRGSFQGMECQAMPWRPENFVDMREIIGLLTRWSVSRTRATLNALHFLLVDFGNWIGMQSGRASCGRSSSWHEWRRRQKGRGAGEIIQQALSAFCQGESDIGFHGAGFGCMAWPAGSGLSVHFAPIRDSAAWRGSAYNRRTCS